MKLIIEDDEGHKTTVPFVRDELTVGREEGNTIRLTERNVSRRHARFFKQQGHIYVEDLKSYNGIKVNGDRIDGAVPLKEGDLVQIGDFDLAVQGEAAALNGANGRASQQTEQMPALGRDLLNQDTSPGIEQVESDPSKPAAPVNRREATALIRVPTERPAPAAAPPPAAAGEEVASDEAPRLVITTTELAGREFACIRTVLTVGRGDECDIVINHRSLSRQHCRIERDGTGTWRVVDLGSSNRMQVNGEEYAESALHAGDIITLGHVKLRFVAPGEDYTWNAARPKKSLVPIFAGAALAAVVVGGGSTYLALQHLKGKSAAQVASGTTGAAAHKPAEPKPPEPKSDEAVAKTDKPEEKPAAEAPPKPEEKPEAQAEKKPEAKPPEPAADADAQRLSAAIAQADQKLARAHDPEGALAMLNGVKDIGVGDPAYASAVKHMQDEQLNRSLIDDARRGPASSDTLKRLQEIPDNSVFHAEATKLLTKYEKQVKLMTKAQEKKEAAARKSEKGAPTPVLTASADDDKPKRALELKKAGVEKMRNGEFEAALPLFQKAVGLDGRDPDNLKQLARCLARLGRFTDAAVYYRQFLSLAPNDPDAPTIRQGLKEYENAK